MNRRGFFSLLAGIAGAIGIGKVPWAGERRSPVKSPETWHYSWFDGKDELPLTPFPYEWKQLHAQVVFTPGEFDAEAQKAYRLIEERIEATRKEMEDGS